MPRSKDSAWPQKAVPCFVSRTPTTTSATTFVSTQGLRYLFLITKNEPLVAAWPLTVVQGPVAVGQCL